MEIGNAYKPSKLTEVRPGYTVKVYQKIKEGNKERIQVYEGLIIKVNSGNGIDSTMTVRKIVQGIGVEKIIPLFSPTIDRIEIVKTAKVRRAKLYYMRDRSGKSARLKETWIKQSKEPIKKEELEDLAQPSIEESKTEVV